VNMCCIFTPSFVIKGITSFLHDVDFSHIERGYTSQPTIACQLTVPYLCWISLGHYDDVVVHVAASRH